ncbi:MAG: glycerol-3-phosphate acyltransferase [Lachnospiraceae bacterium]|nr:glycerol-3-phosphate acyltransferase [Lachnospiraceae bacterium]
MAERIGCLIIGYICGCFMTAELVCRKLTGKPAGEVGKTGNPGMANVMASLGFKPGILVLAGDIGKTIAGVVLAWLLFGSRLGHICVLWAALGVTLGHDLPFWLKMHGGKGVATTCAGIVLFSPFFGFLSMIAGMLVVFATQSLALGGVVIPAAFAICMALREGSEAGWLSAALLVLMIWRHFPALKKIGTPQMDRTDVLGAIRKNLRKS